ncbi:MAG: hypothetical protein SGPRY_002202 [Prymnesium sp.]
MPPSEPPAGEEGEELWRLMCLTRLSPPAAALLLEAAAGDLHLAAQLHFEEGAPALAAGGEGVHAAALGVGGEGEEEHPFLGEGGGGGLEGHSRGTRFGPLADNSDESAAAEEARDEEGGEGSEEEEMGREGGVWREAMVRSSSDTKQQQLARRHARRKAVEQEEMWLMDEVFEYDALALHAQADLQALGERAEAEETSGRGGRRRRRQQERARECAGARVSQAGNMAPLRQGGEVPSPIGSNDNEWLSSSPFADNDSPEEGGTFYGAGASSTSYSYTPSPGEDDTPSPGEAFTPSPGNGYPPSTANGSFGPESSFSEQLWCISSCQLALTTPHCIPPQDASSMRQVGFTPPPMGGGTRKASCPRGAVAIKVDVSCSLDPSPAIPIPRATRSDSSPLEASPSPKEDTFAPSSHGSEGRRRSLDRSEAWRAERIISRVRWDPCFEEARGSVVVEWKREERHEQRKSGAAAWSQRVRHVPCQQALHEWLEASSAPPYHLVLRLLQAKSRLPKLCEPTLVFEPDECTRIAAQILLQGSIDTPQLLRLGHVSKRFDAAVERLVRRSEERLSIWRHPPLPAAWQVLAVDSTGERRRNEEGAVRALSFDGGGLLATADGGCVRLCTSSDLLVSGGSDGLLSFFDLEELTRYATLRGHGAPISDCAILTDARCTAASTSIDGAVKLWDASGAHLLDVQPSFVLDRPPGPVPMSARGGNLNLARGYELLRFDLQVRTGRAEQIAGRLPLPVQLPPLHLAAADPERSHVVAVSCLKASAVHLFDHRLMPASHPGEVQDVDLLPVAPLIDSNILTLSLDHDWEASSFSRTASEVALYDMRAVGTTPFLEMPPPPLWQAPVKLELK